MIDTLHDECPECEFDSWYRIKSTTLYRTAIRQILQCRNCSAKVTQLFGPGMNYRVYNRVLDDEQVRSIEESERENKVDS